MNKGMDSDRTSLTSSLIIFSSICNNIPVKPNAFLLPVMTAYRWIKSAHQQEYHAFTLKYVITFIFSNVKNKSLSSHMNTQLRMLYKRWLFTHILKRLYIKDGHQQHGICIFLQISITKHLFSYLQKYRIAEVTPHVPSFSKPFFNSYLWPGGFGLWVSVNNKSSGVINVLSSWGCCSGRYVFFIHESYLKTYGDEPIQTISPTRPLTKETIVSEQKPKH
nr:hypothetical protein [Alteribacillus persepolensis]